MKLFRFSLSLIFLYLLFTTASLNAQDDDLSRYYPLTDGYKWEYEIVKVDTSMDEEVEIRGREKVGDVETVRMVCSSEDNGDDYLANDSEGIKIYKEIDVDGSYEIYERPSVVLPFDIEKTEVFKNEAAYTGYDQEGRLEYKAVSSEEIWFKGRADVIVPAGSFQNCLRLFRIEKWNRSSGNSGEERIETWLAESIGLVKMIITETEYVMEDGQVTDVDVDVEEWRLKKAVLGDKIYGQ